MNAQMSTGPRSQAGKNISKFNNLRWGCYAKELILPGESAEELQERCDRWVKDLRPMSEPERYEVFNAVHATWRQDRMRRAEAIALADLVDKTTEQFYEQKEQEARDLIARLPEAPGDCVQGLRNSTAGLTWMIDQIEILVIEIEPTNGEPRTGISPNQRRHLIHLCGKRAVDLFAEIQVAYVNRLYLALAVAQQPHPAKAAIRELQGDRPPAMEASEFEDRLQNAVAHLPPFDKAHAELNHYLATMHAELTERRALIALREERDLARAIGKAKGDAGAETAQRQRVENSMDRQRRMSLKEFRALVNSRPEPGEQGPDGDGDGDDTPVEPGPGTEPDTSPAQPARATEHDGGAPAAPAATTAATGSGVMTRPVAPIAEPVEAVETATTDTIAEADTPQKCKSEPTCQNGRREEVTETARPSDAPAEAQAPGDAATLTGPSGALSQGERNCCAVPDATVGVTGSAIPRAGTDSVIPDGCAKDDISDTNHFPGGTGHQ
jgi:hypothetical protein